MYTLSHRYQWTGDGPAKRVLSISVNGTLKTTETNLEDIAGDNGNSGTLVLPNDTYEGMSIRDISYEDGTWAPWGRVAVNFDNDNSSGTLDKYTITWCGYTIYNPKLTISPSTIKIATTAIHGINGWQRQQLGHGIFKINISGTIITPSGIPPTGFIGTLEETYSSILDPYPSGYPKVFDLITKIPESSGYFNAADCIISDGSAAWHVEDDYADISIDLLAPPQTL
jgi:hypothetical protein